MLLKSKREADCDDGDSGAAWNNKPASDENICDKDRLRYLASVSASSARTLTKAGMSSCATRTAECATGGSAMGNTKIDTLDTTDVRKSSSCP